MLSASDAKAVATAMNLRYCICQKIDDVYTDIVTEANQDEATGLKSALQQHFVDVQKYDRKLKRGEQMQFRMAAQQAPVILSVTETSTFLLLGSLKQQHWL